MADTFPVSTDSPALAALAPSRRYTPSPEELARQAAAAEHLAQVAAKAGLTPEDILRAGTEAERRHEVLDLDADSTCPFEGACRYPYLTLGGQP
ncbi:hypothetical protein [Streptomyces sp. WM6349]|uniref:hypothetical protein n=1 Tax=Streptomyces sp. WM6349 TaxID=1415552 RepID=UPI0006AFA7F9|nr:hypothetical protein [Streptomyces sp. WM6349]KOU17062.1 hypothetical protein ADK49_17165 [Streptomyces sp. WM6349]